MNRVAVGERGERRQNRGTRHFATGLPLGGHLAARLLARFYGISSGDLLVPGWVERPCPGLADGTANHALEGARFADGAEVDVNEDPAEHDEGGDIMNHVADGDGNSAEGSCAGPHDDAGDQIDDAAAYDLPELHFLPGIEEAGVRRIHLLFTAHDLLDVAHPASIGWSPEHGLEPIQSLQCEKEDEGDSEVWVQDAAERASSEDGCEPSEEPGQVNSEAGEKREEEEKSDGPMDDAGVYRVAEKLSPVDGGVAHRLKLPASLIVKTFDRIRGH
jgi:hypothetical protein